MKLKLKGIDDIIFIDDNIAEEIVILNDKGYITTACCGGHLDKDIHLITVVFDKNYNLEPPKGFRWVKKGLVLLFYITPNGYKPTEKYNKEMIIFKQWVKDLPKNNLE